MSDDKVRKMRQSQVDPDFLLARRDSLIEEKIRDAQAAGIFDNLPGQGKPIPKDPAQDLDGAGWMSNRILRQAGFVPEWVTLRKEIAAERPEVADTLSAYRTLSRAGDLSNPDVVNELQQLETRYIARAGAINKKMDTHNGRCPPSQELSRFVEDATRRWS